MNFATTKSRAVTGLAVMILSLLSAGCAATYVPISWHYRVKSRQLAHSDPKLAILYDHCDPKLTTLRFDGQSFDQVMLPAEVPHHYGAYRRDTGIIYRNLEYHPNDQDLRDLLVHEVSHHCWYTALNEEQRRGWEAHLASNPSPLQMMVRSVYENPDDFDTEDFSFTMEYARPVDIEALVSLKVITREEGDLLLKQPVHAMPEWHAKKAASVKTTAADTAKTKEPPVTDDL